MKTCLPFVQDKHVDPDASRPGTGYTDIDNGIQDEWDRRDTDMEHDKQNEHHADLHIHKDEYVVCHEKKTVVHYIDLVLDEEDEDGDTEVHFLRKAHEINNAYVDPVVEDIHAVPVTSVNVVLSRPVDEQCPTKRTTGIKRFPVNLEHYHTK